MDEANIIYEANRAIIDSLLAQYGFPMTYDGLMAAVRQLGDTFIYRIHYFIESAIESPGAYDADYDNFLFGLIGGKKKKKNKDAEMGPPDYSSLHTKTKKKGQFWSKLKNTLTKAANTTQKAGDIIGGVNSMINPDQETTNDKQQATNDKPKEWNPKILYWGIGAFVFVVILVVVIIVTKKHKS